MPKPWRKLLWTPPRYPDNYTDSSFLSDLLRNPSTPTYNLYALVADSTNITQHLCIVAIFVSVFCGIYRGELNAGAVGGFGAVTSVIGWYYFGNGEGKNTLKSALVILSALLSLSPLLKSLTISTASDSIWALSSWLFLVNVFFHAYSPSPVTPLSSSLSTNAAIMASVVLASRLATIFEVFFLLLFSIQLFALFPLFRKRLFKTSFILHFSLTGVCFVSAVLGLQIWVSGSIASMFVVGMIGVVLLAPFWFLRLQRWKDEIRGPWDTARPVFRVG